MADPDLPEVSVIIINWNSKDRLRACLGSLAANLGDIRHEVIVVDNASSDGTSAMVKELFPAARLLENTGNKGFAAANNQGIALSRGGYLLLLNPDTLVLPGAVQGMLAFMKSEPEAAVVGPAFAGAPGLPALVRPEIYRFPGVKDELLRDTFLEGLSSGLRRLAGRGGSPGTFAGSPATETDWVSGACMLVRRKAADEVGGMDSRFFLYMEELEWCYRIKLHGWKIFILPQLGIVHIGGASSDKVEAAALFAIYYDSRYKFFEKHWPRAQVAALRAAKAVLLAVSALWYLLVKLAVPARSEEAGVKIRACGAAIPVILKIREVGQGKL